MQGGGNKKNSSTIADVEKLAMTNLRENCQQKLHWRSVA
jgi:hypothetical protein